MPRFLTHQSCERVNVDWSESLIWGVGTQLNTSRQCSDVPTWTHLWGLGNPQENNQHDCGREGAEGLSTKLIPKQSE